MTKFSVKKYNKIVGRWEVDKVSKEDIDYLIGYIDNYNQVQMCEQWRFSPLGYFQNGEIYNYWEKRFKELGEMTPQVSKLIGW